MFIIKKRYFNFCKGPMQGLDNTTLTAAKYSINFTESGKKLFKPA